LWYCMRVPGTHMYRGELVDNYMKVAIFTDPGVVDLVKSKFVALRMACDEKTSGLTGIKRFDFVEPGLIVLSPDGTLVHKIDRIRTFNADWVRAALIEILKKDGAHNAPAGDTVEDLIRGGDDEQAFPKASVEQKALLLRRKGRFEEVLKLDCSPREKGMALVGLQRFEEARKLLEKDDSAEALYYRSACDVWTGRNPEALWREAVTRHPESPWAWRAASDLVKGPDTLPDGPMAHLFEDFFLVPPREAPSSTRLPSTDFEGTARRAVSYLLRAQREDGSWNEARYSYWPDVKIQPNVFVAVTTLAAMALQEWRELDPVRIDAAVARAEKYILDEGHLNPGQNEECYAHAYRLLYLARKADVPAMNRVVLKLVALQDKDGFWGHEYPNPFASAAVVHCLYLARQAGADVPDSYFKKAADGLLKTRAPDGRQAYDSTRGPSNEKSSMGRISPCELALWECGRGSIDNVATGLAAYWRQLEKIEAIRVCDFHADEELGGFFFWHAVFHSCEAARALPDEAKRREHLSKFRAQVLAIPEWDGSFLDSHELGKSYGTSMALLVLGRTR
ncbi:MAG TPA: prenyltransferase/squalene oxidase repeat-containing protein, partial [Planctomycetota bacterium]|nr:prenyltransferase/squalene oxidase repeat-containing protein [Planctomycetota bacterium]